MSNRPLRASARPLLLALCLPFSTAGAAPFISEFLADNETGLQDEDGERPDWIEIHNPDATPVSLDGWYLTDSAANLTKWRFPAVTLEPGEFKVVFASSKNRRVPGQPLHTNFSLSADGEYLALVRPDGTAEQQFAPEFPAQDPDRAFGLSFTSMVLSPGGSPAQYRIPASAADIAENWKSPDFSPAGWTQNAPTGIGYGLTIPGMTVTIRRKANGELNSLADVDALLALPSGNAGIAQEIVSVLPVFNLLGEGGDGHYPDNTPVGLASPDDYVARATGYIVIPTAGQYTFGINSDDGGRIRIDGANVMVDNTLHGAEDHLGTVTLTAGVHSFEALYWERGGGDEGEFYAAAGAHSSWNSSMKLVGDTANGGLTALTPSPGSGGTGAAVIRTNVQAAMQNKNASAFIRVPFTVDDPAFFAGMELAMQYNDGFVAWLNGTEIARRNAPAELGWNSASTLSRTDTESLVPEVVNITAALPSLRSGPNVLAIQGLNASAADGTFLILPEIAAGAPVSVDRPGFLDEPTPGRVNGGLSSLGRVEDTSFNPKRGLYPNAAVTSVPFPVTITSATPGAVIRFTTDGTAPTETYGTIYTGPITISDNTVIRAMAYKTGLDSTNVDTHTYILPDKVLTQSPNGEAPPGWPVRDANGNVGGHTMDYGMDPDIVNNANPLIGGAETVKAALTAIPSLSLVTPLASLFDPNTGIYIHPGGRGFSWERPASIEWINDPNLVFQANCGIRMRGGFSRSSDNPKHAFHVYFRGEYGLGKLRVPLFGSEGASEFDQLDFRTSQNYSWSFQNDSRNTFLREEFSRVTQLAMGQPGSRVRYFHLYINGQYWGLFDTDERTEADYCATYFGGEKDNWDVVKAEQDSGYITGPTDGNTDAWHLLFTKANPLVSPNVYTRRALTEADYFGMQGLAADGETPNEQPVLLDVDNLIDYMLLTFWTGNLDGATSAFLGNFTANNWFGARDRTGTAGFKFFAHDFEHSLFSLGEDRTGPFNRGFSNQGEYDQKKIYYNPMFLHADLMDVPAYRRRFGDRAQMHMFNGGALTPVASAARLTELATVVDSAIAAESARWGDAKNSNPYTRAHWRGARDEVFAYLPGRGAPVINQLRADGLYPSTGGVSINLAPGYVPAGSEARLSAEATAIYYTLDGSDPLGPDGAPGPGAVAYEGGTVDSSVLVAAGSAWKYLEPSTDLGGSAIVVGNPAYNASNWKHPDFNDSGAVWKTGNAEIGYGDGDEVTVIPSNTNGQRTPVLYVRKQFNVTNPSAFTELTLSVHRDDGAIVYINGVEVGRSNMPQGEVGHDYSGSITDDETSFVPVTGPGLTPSVLRAGVNTICVQVHNGNSGSTDVSFDLRLAGRTETGSKPVVLPDGITNVKARAVTDGVWSALTDAVYLVGAEAPSTNNLAISEFLYHPVNPTGAEEAAGFNDDNFFEYIELLNTGAFSVDLRGVKFANGVMFDFTDSLTGRLLAPGARLLVVSNTEAFAMRYGAAAAARVAGVFEGNLNNSGERLTLVDARGDIIQDLTYSDSDPWPAEPDTDGTSLVLVSPETRPDSSLPGSWRAGTAVGGSPGVPDGVSYAAWKTARGITDDTADGDGDGLTGVLEYAFGGDPAVSDAARLPAAGVDEIDTGEGLTPFQTLTVIRALDAVDSVISAEASTDLDTWDGEGCELASRMWNGDGTETLVFRAKAPFDASSRQFLRARVRVP